MHSFWNNAEHRVSIQQVLALIGTIALLSSFLFTTMKILQKYTQIFPFLNAYS